MGREPIYQHEEPGDVAQGGVGVGCRIGKGVAPPYSSIRNLQPETCSSRIRFLIKSLSVMDSSNLTITILQLSKMSNIIWGDVIREDRSRPFLRCRNRLRRGVGAR